MYIKYLRRDLSISDIADELGVTYESAKVQMQRIRRRVKSQVLNFMKGQLGGIA